MSLETILSLTFHASGHPAVLSTHPSTIEITKDAHLSARGDCIIAVNSTMGPADIERDLRSRISRSGSRIQLILSVGRFHFTVTGQGDSRLTLSHPTDLVIRRSGFISDRTLMIHADKAANDVPPEMVRLLRDPKTKVTIEISTSTLD
jgi:hypothetical protein